MRILSTLLLVMLLMTLSAQAQFDVKNRIKNKVHDRIDQKIDQGIDKGLDKIEEEAIETLTDEKEEGDVDDQQQEDAVDKEQPLNEEANGSNKDLAAVATEKQEEISLLKSYSKYDFISGDKVIFYDDFSQDAVGDFPALWSTNGSGEVMTTNIFPGKWFMMTSEGSFMLEKGIDLPANCTVEFDLIPVQDDAGAQMGTLQLTVFAPVEGNINDMGGMPGEAGIELNMGSYFFYRAYSENKDMQNEIWDQALLPNKVFRISIWIQNSRLRLYALGNKIIDVPQALTKGFDYRQLRFNNVEAGETRFMISDFRVAEAGSDQRHKFMTDGKLISYGILFDVNSDRIKPESYGAVKEMADIMKENPGVKVKVVGHTDSDGDEKANLDLSKRRAASVKNELVKTFDIDASRLETDGKGEGEPIESNTTSLGKAKNRRVEFLKQ
ncbi:OmpA family protein [Roseimarinus sediminis]|uniref:OmpA family protein n=1 Tax=Roseimarinus sediminis TaxID=1610899 RepID=UPI003D20672A